MQDLQERDSAVADLVAQAADGDRDSWEALVERFGPLVWGVARRRGLSAADAADVAQTTWMRLLQHLGRLQQPERVAGWLATTAHRESMRVRRLAARNVPAQSDEVADLTKPTTSLDDDLLVAERNGILWQCFAELPPRCQRILGSLMADTPTSYQDLSAMLDMPVGSIGPTRARCLEHLRRLVATSHNTEVLERL